MSSQTAYQQLLYAHRAENGLIMSSQSAVQQLYNSSRTVQMSSILQ
jgi:hypothetical protein